MASLYQVGETFYIRFTIRTKDNRKVIKRVSTGYTDESAARKVMGEVEQRVRKEFDAQDSDHPPITLEKAIEIFEKSRKDMSKATVNAYSNICKKMIGKHNPDNFGYVPYCLDGNTFLHEISNKDLVEYSNARFEEKLKPRSVALELKIIIAIHNYAKKQDYRINPNLTAEYTQPKAKTRIFTIREELAIIEKGNALDTRITDLFVFLMETGCRINEALKIQQGDWDEDDNALTLRRSKTDSQTVLALSDKAQEILGKYADKAEPFGGFGRVMIRLRDIISEVCNGPEKRALIERDGRATIHTTRHTYTTRAVKAGNDLHTVGLVLGHTMSTMTAKYAHLGTHDASKSMLRKKA